MASRYEVEVTVTSAADLKNVNWRHGKLRPYAVVWVDPNAKFSTRVDDSGDTNPYWDQTLLVAFSSPIDDSTLHIDIVHAAAEDDCESDTKPLVGSAKLPLRDVVDNVGFGGRFEKNLELKRPSGRPHGRVDVHVTVREPPRYRAPEPYSAHPYGVPPPGTRDYPPQGYEYPYGAPPGYAAYGGAPPPAYAQGGYYGQPAYGQAAYGEEPKKSRFGGMGTGLAVGAVAGVVGGIALSQGFDALEDKIADDVAERVEDDLADGEDDF